MDTAVTLRPDAREAWLAQMAADEPELAPLLRKLLSAHQRVETHDVLATLPPMRTAAVASNVNTGSIGAHIGPFELIELLGHGGMGSVWRARYADGRLKRDVAIKLPAMPDNAAALLAVRERFARERDFLGALEHPNIARLYDTGISESGQPYLAMEYVAGEPINSYCDKHRLTITARLTLYLQVLDAVEFAHRQLVLHRDLKPGNVLVDGNGQARLLDFGVAKLLPETTDALINSKPARPVQGEGFGDRPQPSNPLLRSGRTGLDPPLSGAVTHSTHAIAGADLTEMAGAAITLAYAAPEQINHGRLSTATDVYALGVMLYRLLTGSAPYQPKRDTRGALEDEVLTADPALASQRTATAATLCALQTNAATLRKTLSGDIDTILAKALKKHPDERYPTAAALADDVRRYLQQLPITARSDSAWYRTSRFVARHQVAVAASALAVTALIVTTGTALWQSQQATASAVRANREAARLATAHKFLAGMFASADPEQTKSDSLTALQILERGRDAAEKDLANDPEAHALVLAQIGDIYRRMGMHEPLLAVQKRRVAVLEAVPGIDVNTLVDAQLELGRALGDMDSADDNKLALPRLKAAYETAVNRNADAEKIVWALCLIADQYRTEKDLTKARDFAERALVHAERTLPNPNRFLAAAYEANAVVAIEQKRIMDARAHFAKALAIDATGKGRGAVDQAITLTLLANTEFADGDYEAAQQQAQAIVDLAKRNFGDVKANLAPALRLVAFAAARAGDLSGATRLSAESLDAEIASLAPMRAGLAHYARGRIATLRSDFAQAESELNLAANALNQSPIWADRLTIARIELAMRSGNAADALSKAEALQQSQATRLGAKHVTMADTYQWLAVAEVRAGNPAAALTHITQACEIFAELRATHPQRLRVEAYRVLLSPDMPNAAKTTALQDMERTLMREKNKRLPLIQSLRSAQQQLASLGHKDLPANTFPIFD